MIQDTVTGQRSLLAIDGDATMVLEFMRENVQANKLIAVADKVNQVARLLWMHYPQEPCTPTTLEPPKMRLQISNDQAPSD